MGHSSEHNPPEKHFLTRYFGIMVAVYAAWIALYYLTGWIGSLRGPAFDPALRVDAAIPYIPEFLPVYFLAYVIIPGIFLISREPAFLNRAYITMIAANAFAFLFFVIFPALGPERIAASGSGAFIQWITDLSRGMDSRYNAFPSLHAANPWMLFLLSVRKRGWDGITVLFFVLALAIGAATVLVKQHYVLDLAGGIALAIAAVFTVGRIKISANPW